ncbi:Hypothetical protein LUCI_1718 [Lucifera butyrica]|uniref:Uncharacterized protein n=1 Tax=Lucifera butyrica TaxID=1351585 RepID=A0A498R1L0_9FIRM|nr:DUF4209 domain-containing protein [Lucifera butyrica]VBB06486.1 Hypothetical protein LUCI_1718 [Lucifera butyrica]
MSERYTIEDSDSYLWEEVIDLLDEKTCLNYHSKFFEKMRSVETTDNNKSKEVYKFLGDITSLCPNYDSRDEPYKALIELGASRSAILDDFIPSIETLKELIPKITDPELRARIADVVWIIKHDYNFANIAIQAYLGSYNNLLKIEMFGPSIERIKRAVQLINYLGKNKKLYTQVTDIIENTLERFQEIVTLNYDLIKILLEMETGNPDKYSVLTEKFAKKSEYNRNFYWARWYWDLSARWYSKKKDVYKVKECRKSAAETFVKDADLELEKEKPSYNTAASHILSAIEGLRRVGGEKERIDELHSRLLEYQKKSMSEIGTIKIELLTPEQHDCYAEYAKKRVRGKSLGDAINVFAYIASSPKMKSLRDNIDKMAKEYPLQYGITGVVVNESGKIVKRKPSMMSDDPNQLEAAIKAEMFMAAVLVRARNFVGLIEPARRELLLEHKVNKCDLYDLVSYNPFIPDGRERIFAEGLYYGFIGDFLLSTHLLIPQLENSIRYILEATGGYVPPLDDAGIQLEANVNSLLYNEKLTQILGEDIVFDLQGLLIEEFGSNMRNKLAHGLIDFYGFYDIESAYIWWITLRLCCGYKLIYLKQIGEEK